MTYIRSAEDRFRPILSMPELTPPERIVAQFWQPFGIEGLPQDIDSDHPVLVAINHGRWVIHCPWCPSAQLASREDRRFFCVECSNRGAGGRWIPVEWPEEEAKIELLLGRRPDPRTRNWFHRESVESIAAETDFFLGQKAGAA